MNIELIISALRSRCPSFSGRVAGAAQYKQLPETSALAVPCAYVIPLDDNPGESIGYNTVRQPLTDSFAVVVALDNRADERGQAAIHTADSVRAELWAALLGWSPSDRYDGVTYEGGALLALDRARLWYQFEFGALMELAPDDGYQATELAALPHFDGLTINVDPIFDGVAPDGVIDARFDVPKTGNLP